MKSKKIIISLLILFVLGLISWMMCKINKDRYLAAQNAIVCAVKKGELDKIKGLLDKYPEFAKENPDLLEFATEEGYAEVALLLISKGADVNASDELGFRPLHSAWKKDVAELLISRGADINAGIDKGGTPLHVAARRFSIDDINGTCEITKVLISHGALVNARDRNGMVPLHLAALLGNVEIADLLISHGAEVDSMDTLKWTPLFYAAMSGRNMVGPYDDCYEADWKKLDERYLKTIELLVSKGAQINAKDREGTMPLHNAVMGGNKDIVRALITFGANVNGKDKGGRTPLYYAIQRGHKDIVNLLRRHGAKE